MPFNAVLCLLISILRLFVKLRNYQQNDLYRKFKENQRKIIIVSFIAQPYVVITLGDRFIFIGPESDHWLCLSLTHSLTDSLTHSVTFSKLD